MDDGQPKHGYITQLDGIPALWPTHGHSATLWEALGRTIATFGFLEETLAKAIFALTATKHYEEHELKAAFEKWYGTLERALSDQLGQLIVTYERVARAHQSGVIDHFDDLIADLRSASKIRNVLCHGSWRPADADGNCHLFFFSKDGRKFEDEVNEGYLRRIQIAAARLAVVITNTVTRLGWQFPGSGGPGIEIFSNIPKSKT